MCIREEELLAIQPVAVDGFLAFLAGNPVDEALPQVFFHCRMLDRTDQNDAILIEEGRVAFDMNFEIALFLKLIQVALSVSA